MKKYIFVIVIILGLIYLSGVPVAWVDGIAIDSSEYEEELELLPDSLDLIERRQVALDNLIEKELLIRYAQEEGIEVTEEEVETIFIKEFYDHPLFCTEGEFDYALYYRLKDSEKVRKILKVMSRDILIEKTRELINRQLELTGEELLERYILENVSLDVSYAEFNLDEVSISRRLSASGARQFWKIHREDYSAEEEYKFGYTIIPFADFSEEAATQADSAFIQLKINDLLTPEVLRDSVNNEKYASILKEKNYKLRKETELFFLDKITHEEAQKTASMLEKGYPIPYPQLTTGFLKEGEKSGAIPVELIKQALSTNPGLVSEPYRTEKGYVLFWKIEQKMDNYVDLSNVRKEVWLDYINDQSFHSQSGEFRRYFYNNLDEFKIPAASIYRVELFRRKKGKEVTLGDERAVVVSELEKYLFNLSYMSSVARSNGLQVERRMIYLQRYHFRDYVDEMIAGAVSEGETYGVLEHEGKYYFYVLESYIPSYIPDFEDLNITDYFGVEVDNLYSEDEFRNYYENHKQDFDTADSVALGGVHYYFDTDTIKVEFTEIADYYEDNYNRFYHEDAVECRYIHCRNWERAKLAYTYLRNGIDYELVKWGFGDLAWHIPDGIAEYSEISPRIRKLLQSSMEFSYLYPIETEEGWLICNKLAEYGRGYYQLYDVQEQIRDEIADFKADSLAYNYAKAVFDSTTYFSDCYLYADTSAIFETRLQEIDMPYEQIGDISAFRSSLLRLWRNEKLTRLIETPRGYAVLFMRRKMTAKERSFEEALPEIKEIFTANKQLELAQNYIEGIIEDLKKGIPADSLLYFLGGYKRLKNIHLGSEVPGFEQSKILIEDMLKHETGYYSPVLRLGEGKLMFYHINDMQRVSREDFLKVKDKYREEINAEIYDQWYQDYRERKYIRIEK